MIKRKTAYGSVGADTIKMMKDGVEVEIEKVISYDAGGAQTENEIFPNALTFVEISTNYDDERTDEVPEPLIEDYWQRHNMPNVNIALPSHTSDPFTINVDVYPSNAEWYFETQYLNSDEVLIGPYYIEGITHNGTTPIIYKGSQTFIDVLPELATETYIDVQLDVKPKKGSLSNRAVLWFRQTREDIIISDFASKFDFNNAILQSTDGTLNTYTNFFNDNYAGAETPEFREVRYDSETLTSHLGLVIADFNDSRYQAVEQVYSTEFGGGYDFGLAQVQSAALRESGIYYEIDMDAAIPDRWYDGGFSVSYVVDPTDVLKGFQAGFLEN